MRKVCNNAYQQYIRSRPGASVESVKRVKELSINEAGILPQYSDVSPIAENLISRMRNYRPQGVSTFIDEEDVEKWLFQSYYLNLLFTYNRQYSRLVQKLLPMITK